MDKLLFIMARDNRLRTVIDEQNNLYQVRERQAKVDQGMCKFMRFSSYHPKARTCSDMLCNCACVQLPVYVCLGTTRVVPL